MTNTAVIKWLSARVQKKKGIVQIPMVEQAFALMDGWSIESITTYVVLNGNSNLQRALLEGDTQKQLGANYMSSALTLREPIGFRYGSRGAAEEGLKVFERMFDTKISPRAKIPDGEAQLLKVYATKPEVREPQWAGDNDYYLQVPKMWLGVRGWRIRSANGASVDLPSPLTRRGKPEDQNRLESFATFWTWSYKNGLAESAKQALDGLDGSTVSEATATAVEREKLTQQRIMLPEVRDLLLDLTQKQYNDFWAAVTNMHVQALQAFMLWQETNKGGSIYRFLKDHEAYSFAQPYLHAATDRHDVVVDGYVEIAREFGKRIADSVRENFVAKNGMKLSLIVKAKGNLKQAKVLHMNSGADYGGEIAFTFKDGSSFIVRNKTVFKYSSLGRPFEQYPTTFHNVVLPDGKAMSQPSEKRMVEVFAGQVPIRKLKNRLLR